MPHRTSGKHILLRRLLKNAGSILGANVFASVMSALALAIVARALQPADFGAFAVITALVFVIDNLVNFQSWQAVIRYGAQRLSAGDHAGFTALVKVTATLDVACAFIGCAAAAATAILFRYTFDWDAQTAGLAAWFALIVATRMTGTPTGILRLLDRFDLLAYQQAIVGLLRISFILLVWLLGGELALFLCAWGIAEAIGNTYLILMAWREFGRKGFRHNAGTGTAWFSRLEPGFWSFVWTTNMHASVKTAIRELDVLVLGAIAGSTSAGLYKIAKQVGAVAAKVVGPLYQAVYPELARAVAENDRQSFKLAVMKPTKWATVAFAAFFLAFIGTGRPLLDLFLGAAYLPAFLPSIIYLSGCLLSAATFALHPAVLALGDATGSFRVLLASTLVYALSFPALVTEFDVSGAAAAFVVFYIVWSVLMIKRLMNRFAAHEWVSHRCA